MTDLLPPEDETRATILVVDDEPEILVALQDLLDDEYRVIASSSPRQALSMLRTEPGISVIISDQRMPDLTGDAFLAEARAYSDAEAILLTGYADLKAVVSALNRGRIVGYLPKPWDPETLRSMVASACQRHKLARELDVERALLHGLLDSTRDAVAFKDIEGRFVRLNRRKAESLGVGVEECLGRTEAELAEGGTSGIWSAAEREAIKGGPVIGAVERRDVEEGVPRWYAVDCLPVHGAGGAMEHLVTIERDITEQRLMEERLRQSEKLQALGTLAGGIAHDFNNLLMAVIGSLDMALRREPTDDRRERLMRLALEAADKGKSLTQRLLSFSRQRGVKVRPVDANALILGMDELLQRTLGGLIRVELQLAAEPWLAQADPDQLELAILNLCINARDAMPQGGTLTIRTECRNVADASQGIEPGPYLVIAVQDSGTGIPPEILSRVLEPFFTTKEVGKGTGLGLSIVYGAVQSFGGGMRIESSPGQGTTVELYLARAESAVEELAQEAGSLALPAPLRVLVVDDDDDVREVVASYLEEMGQEVMTCSTIASALDQVEAGRVEMVVVDFAMPGMTGVELAVELRERHPSLPMLLVTGYADLRSLPTGVEVLFKPFQRDELAAALAKAMRAASGAPSEEPELERGRGSA